MKTSYINEQIGFWFCIPCDSWWGCQPLAEPKTWRLFKLNNVVYPAEGPASAARAWIVSGPDPAVCPECGQRMMEQTANGAALPVLSTTE